MIVNESLWALNFGGGAMGSTSGVLYFTAGLSSNTDGLFGALSVPEPSSAALGVIALGMVALGMRWKHRRREALA